MAVAEKRVREETERTERTEEEQEPRPTPVPEQDDEQEGGEQGGEQYDAPNQQAVRPDGSGPADEGDGGARPKSKKKAKKG